ncbi:MAG: hypothetical protein NVSMB32_11470 [Actinomycetota bacterium]
MVALATLVLAGCGQGINRAQPPALGDDAIGSVEAVASGTAMGEPLDATPDPAGTTIYFSALGAEPVIFRVPAAGGPLVTVTMGAPLRKAQGIAISTDGALAYVADPQADRVFSVPTAGGAPSVVTGTEGWAPKGLEVVSSQGTDLLYFTGTDPSDKAAGLFSIPAGGGTVSAVAKGGPFVSPEGVVVASSGVAYVTDHGTGTAGSVLQVSGNVASTLLSGIHLGSPAGITLGRDDKQVLVSSLDAATGADQLLFIDLASRKTTVASKVIGANHDSSAGLHRARNNTSTLAWADCTPCGGRFSPYPQPSPSRGGHAYKIYLT